MLTRRCLLWPGHPCALVLLPVKQPDVGLPQTAHTGRMLSSRPVHSWCTARGEARAVLKHLVGTAVTAWRLPNAEMHVHGRPLVR